MKSARVANESAQTVVDIERVDLVEAIHRVPLFRHLKPAQHTLIAGAGTVKTYPPGTVLARAGDPYTGLFIVIAGQVSLTDGEQGIVLDPGDSIGELAAIELEVAPYQVVTDVLSDVFLLRTHDLYPLIRNDPEISLAIMRTLSRRVREATPLPTEVSTAEVGMMRQQMLSYAQDFQTLFESEREHARELQESIMATVRLLIAIIEKRAPGALSHGVRVGRCAQAIARHLDWSEDERVYAMLAGLLHDIGLLDLNVSVRGDMTGPYDREVLRAIRRHPETGAKLLDNVSALKPLVPYVQHHHELVDGTGYPHRLRGDQISPQGRLLAVAEAFEELLANTEGDRRVSTAYQTMMTKAGQQYDREYVSALAHLIATGDIS